MQNLIIFIGVVGPMIFNFHFLYNRKKKWAQSKMKWYSITVLFLVGLILLFIVDFKAIDGRYFLASWGLLTPLIFALIDWFFEKWSELIHNRNFYLWLRGSIEINESKFSGGKHVKASDRVFSLILLFLILLLPFAIIIF